MGIESSLNCMDTYEEDNKMKRCPGMNVMIKDHVVYIRREDHHLKQPHCTHGSSL